MTLSKLLSFAMAQTWALQETFHRRMFQVLMSHESGKGPGAALAQFAAAAATKRDRREAQMTVADGVATIPIHGVIAHRASAVDPVCSDVGTSVEHIRGDLQAALANEDVHSIVLQIDSPGGSVFGLADLAAEIRAAREQKPIVAHTDELMASAAYWLGSQADRIVATTDAEVGSIGVIASFFDAHRLYQGAGVDPVVIKSTPGKGSTQGNGSFGDAQRAEIQQQVDHFHAMFVADVAAGRRISPERAAELADGRVLIGAEALRAGLVDEIASLQVASRTARELGSRAAAARVESRSFTEEPTEPVASSTMTQPATTQASQAPAAPSPNLQAAIDQAVAQATSAERSRVLAILKGSAAKQLPMAIDLVEKGASTVDALVAINSDLRSQFEASAQKPSANTAPLAAGNAAAVTEPPAPDAAIKAMPDGEAKWKAEWDASGDLRAEFPRQEVYVAFRKNEHRSKVIRG